MHILIIAQFFPPDFGGASTRAYNVAKGLTLQGCKVTVVCGFPHYPHGKIPSKYGRKFSVKEKMDNIDLIRTWVPSVPHTSNFNRLRSHFGFVFSSFLGSLKVNNFDINKIKIIVGLIYLNMSPLHQEPFDKLLFCLSKEFLLKGLGNLNN